MALTEMTLGEAREQVGVLQALLRQQECEFRRGNAGEPWSLQTCARLCREIQDGLERKPTIYALALQRGDPESIGVAELISCASAREVRRHCADKIERLVTNFCERTNTFTLPQICAIDYRLFDDVTPHEAAIVYRSALFLLWGIFSRNLRNHKCVKCLRASRRRNGRPTAKNQT